MLEMDRERQVERSKFESERLRAEEQVKSLRKARTEIETEYTEAKDEIINDTKMKESQLEVLKEEYLKIKNEITSLESFHKEQKNHYLTFFAEAIQPLELV